MEENRKFKKLFLRVVMMMIITFVSISAFAESLSYSGRLVNSNGSPVTGTPQLKFDLAYSGSTGIIRCTDDSNVPLTNGVFHVKLDFDCSASSLSLNEVLALVPPTEALVIRVTNVSASKVYSFQELHSLPLAKVSEVAKQLDANGATNGQILSWDGSKWTPINAPVPGAGSVTSITAGTGLSGGTITSTGTIAIANGGVTDTQIAAGVSRSKLANGTANYVLVNDGTGAMNEVAQLGLTQGGTGSNTASGARTNLGLGNAAVATIGYGVGQVMPGEVPMCLSHQKLQMNPGPAFWSCVNDNDSLDATKLPLAGGTMAGVIDMNNNRIIGLFSPTDPGDAANKAYVDGVIAGASQWTTVGSDIYYNSGDVAIGKTTPTSKLDVAGKIKTTGSDAYLEMHDTDTLYSAGPQAGLVFRDSGDSQYSFIGPISGQMQFFSWIPIELNVNNNVGVHVAVNGNVGIGGTTTTEKLFVSGNAAITGNLRLKSDTANFVDLKAPNSLAGNLIYTLPGTNGTSGQALITDGSGTLSWATVATGASAVGGDLTGTVTNAQIAAGAIVDADIAAGAAIDQSKINGLSTSLSDKEPTINAGTTAQYYRGDKSWQTLDTAAVAESTNLYFTEPRVLGTDLAGYSAGAGVITAADTVLSAIEKLSGNLAASSAAQANYVLKAGDSMSGALAMGNNKITGLATPTVGTDAATMAYVDSQVAAAPGDNLGNHTATTNLALGSNNITGVGRAYVGDGTFSLPAYTFTSATGTGLYNNGGNLGFSASGSLVMTMSSNSLLLNGSYGAYLRAAGTNDATAPTYAFNSDGNTGMFNLSSDILGFTTNGVEKMRILSTGEMAIGKTSAAGKLDVAGDIASDGKLRLKSDNTNFVELRAPASLAATTTYTFPATAGTAGYALTTNGAGVLSWASVATTASTVGGDLSGTIANAQIVANAVGTAEIADTSVTYAKLNLTDGDIPLAKLAGASDATKYLKGNKTWGTFITDVLASTFATVTPSNTVIANADSLQTVVNKTQGQINALKTADNNFLVKNGTDSITGTVTVNAATGALKIPTTPSGVDLTDAANVQYVQNYVGTFGQWTKTGANLSYSAGNVGIGTVSPNNPLVVKSTIPQFLIENGAKFYNFFNDGSSLLIRDGGTSRFTISTSGNVGIGTSTPGSTLEVGKNSASSSSLRFHASETNQGSLRFASDAAANWIQSGLDYVSDSKKDLRFSSMNGTTSWMTIQGSSGNVGIGTSSPLSKLTVSKSASGGDEGLVEFRLGQNQGSARDFIIRKDTTTPYETHLISAANPSTDSGSMRFFTSDRAAGERMAILENGNVGIGTSAPAQKLEVHGHVRVVDNGFQLYNTASPANDRLWAIGNASTENLHFMPRNDDGSPDGSYVMTMQRSGNVGIGTSSPVSKLDISQGAGDVSKDPNSTPMTSIRHGTSGVLGLNLETDATGAVNAPFLSWVDGDGDNFRIRMSNSTLQFGTGFFTPFVTFTNNGRVGIGTSSPTTHLAVNSTTASGYTVISNKNSAAGGQEWRWYSSSTGAPLGTDAMCFGLGACLFILKADGNATLSGTLTQSSDIRLKRNISSIPYALDAVTKLDGVTYYWEDNSKGTEKQIGLIAQNVEKIFPEAVQTDARGMKSVAYQNLVAPIINAIKEIRGWMFKTDERVQTLEKDNAELKRKNEELEKRLEKLEKSLAK